MTAPFKITLKELEALRPCQNELKIIAPMLANGPLNAAEAVEKGATLEHLIWVAGEVGRTNEDVARRLRLFATDCAAHVLHIYEKEHNREAPRRAIEVARAYVEGSATLEELDAAAWAAYATYAADATYAAAAAAAYAAADATYAAARAARAARAAACATERQWQIDRLVYWLMEPDTEVLPLPEKRKRQ